MDQSSRPWWQLAAFYEIYLWSFQDANGDGVGDLAGITRRLDYLKWLGIDAIWVTPFYPSPMYDLGYDISDYCDVHPMFGTMNDLDRLVGEVHARGMRIVIDFVPNHTSIEHPWFRESSASRHNPRRDWYLWHDPKPNGDPPNNWLSVFGGSAWEFHDPTGQYYYHAFLREQPDLNWRNPEVHRAMLDVMRFWLERDVDGFRVDVMWHLIKDAQFRDNPPNPDYQEGQLEFHRLRPAFSTDQPQVHDIVAMMRRLTDEYGDKVLIGEVYLPIEELVTYYGLERSGAHLPFNFQLISLPWDAKVLLAAIDEYEASLPEDAWPNWVLSNHDKRRVATRIGESQARNAAMLLLTLRGTPTLYYGDELGMVDVGIPPGRRPALARFDQSGRHGRLPHRTPMLWGTGNGSFSTADPWLPLGPQADSASVERQREDEHSMLTLHRRLLALRRSEAALRIGTYNPVTLSDESEVLAYCREHDRDRLLVLLNLGNATREVPLPEMSGEVMLSTSLDRAGEPFSGGARLRAAEGVIARLAS